jgi:predicted metal-dependent phosphoesterase TrpH
VKIDLHCHTEASPDSSTPFAAIPPRCREQGIAVQAVADHGTIEGALQVKVVAEAEVEAGAAGPTIIIAEEIRTPEGELIGLFLEENIPNGLSPEETVERIQAQGGLVLLPHGFDPLKPSRLKPSARLRIVDAIDIVETFNTHVSWNGWNRAAEAWALVRGLPTSAGSDAHSLAAIGSAWSEVPDQPIHTPQDLLDALEKGTTGGRWTHPLAVSLQTLWDRVRRRIAELGTGNGLCH